ncbi:MAG: histidine phosphatase family protein [Oscillospiraceae bacterium]|nr:histidine phosphatase family protein [Oscillospiraceae bacterium]
MTLYLIRHGKTAANERGCYCGSTDLPLSETGREELQNKRYSIGNVRFLTSGMQRANETLEILFGAVEYAVEPRFREVDFGIFEMHTYEELQNEPAYQAWLTGDNEANIPPRGESGAQMKARVLEALLELTDDACLITHGGVIAAIMSHLFPGEGKSRYDWQPQNGEGYVIENGTYAPLQ